MQSQGVITRNEAQVMRAQGATLGRAHAVRPARSQGVTTRSQARASRSVGVTTRNQARSVPSQGVTSGCALGSQVGLTSARRKKMNRELKKLETHNPDAPPRDDVSPRRRHRNLPSREVAPVAGIPAQPLAVAALVETSSERPSKRKRTVPRHRNSTPSTVLFLSGRPDLSSMQHEFLEHE